ncbi:MAG: hypothetical protein IT261_13915 [Saprospiraceae bacterium]|nr:hypothetical protein [Saprospiraceae bacterium]
MTQERFFQLVDDPEMLRKITYEELKTLALAYPYAHNLRCLLAIKAAQVDHPDALRNLATASAYSLDRTRLFMLTAPQVLAPQQMLAPEEVLELKPIETVKRELEALTPVAREEKPAEPDYMVQMPAPAFREEMAEKRPTEEPARPPIEPVYLDFSSWFSHFQPPLLKKTEPTLPVPPRVEKTFAPTPVFEEDDEETSRETPKTNGIAQKLAEKSVSENQDVVSETLATLYAKQGYRDKAAQMYARLALLFPEKSAYFAAEIDKLKK